MTISDLFPSVLVTLLVMGGLWLWSVVHKNVTVIDSYWGPGFAVIATTTSLSGGHFEARSLLILALVWCWSLRLGLYLTWRSRGQPEDPRYVAIRARNEPFWIKSLWIVFGLQGALMLVIAMPLQASLVAGKSPLGWLDGLGLGLWVVGLYFEAVGDIQLAQFKANPDNKGKVMDRGLWRYTRHPNYFGDFCVWWGFYLIAVAAGQAWTVFAPILMSFMLMKVSGVPLLEKKLTNTRPAYAEYIRKTSAFFPRPPLD